MAQSSARIVREVHDEPHIEGSRITVRFVHQRVEETGLDPQTVADCHVLDLADVYHALAYYNAHEDEMGRHRRTRERAHEDLCDRVARERPAGVEPDE